MSLNSARKGWLLVGDETAFGAPVQTSNCDTVFWTANTLEGVQQPIQNTASYAQRNKVFSAVGGKQWGQGDVEFNLDPNKSGYFLAGALGTTSGTVSNGIVTHSMSVNQSNAPYSLSIYKDRVVDRQLFAGATVDQFQIKVQDGFATGKASLQTLFPVTSVSGSATTASGTLFRWADYTAQFGSTVSAASSAAATALTEFDITFKNNTEVIFESGKATATRIGQKSFEADGNYTLFFEATSDRDAFYNNSKQGMVCVFNGQAYEKLTINLYSTYTDSFSVETGLDNFFIEKNKFVTTYSQADSKQVDLTLVNANNNY